MIISCDVAWNPHKSRNAVAVVTEQGEVTCLARRLDDPHMLDLVCKWVSGSSALVLLDVPIEGCRSLVGPRRPIENALQHYISLYPAARSEKRGEQLQNAIMTAVGHGGSVTVKEIYPHAVYKFIWAAKEGRRLEEVTIARQISTVLAGSFGPSLVPPKYKGGKISSDKRLSGLHNLHHTITTDLGLKFTQPLEPPSASCTRAEMETLADLYDACLGAAVGWYCAAGNPYAWLAGNEHQGEMLLLADQWLKTQLESYGLAFQRLGAPIG
jgi:hypothetical protein